MGATIETKTAGIPEERELATSLFPYNSY